MTPCSTSRFEPCGAADMDLIPASTFWLFLSLFSLVISEVMKNIFLSLDKGNLSS